MIQGSIPALSAYQSKQRSSNNPDVGKEKQITDSTIQYMEFQVWHQCCCSHTACIEGWGAIPAGSPELCSIPHVHSSHAVLVTALGVPHTCCTQFLLSQKRRPPLLVLLSDSDLSHSWVWPRWALGAGTHHQQHPALPLRECSLPPQSSSKGLLPTLSNTQAGFPEVENIADFRSGTKEQSLSLKTHVTIYLKFPPF